MNVSSQTEDSADFDLPDFADYDPFCPNGTVGCSKAPHGRDGVCRRCQRAAVARRF